MKCILFLGLICIPFLKANLQIFLKLSTTNRNYPIELSKDAVLSDVRSNIMDIFELHPAEYYLSYAGRTLNDPNALISDLGICSEATILIHPLHSHCDCCDGLQKYRAKFYFNKSRELQLEDKDTFAWSHYWSKDLCHPDFKSNLGGIYANSERYCDDTQILCYGNEVEISSNSTHDWIMDFASGAGSTSNGWVGIIRIPENSNVSKILPLEWDGRKIGINFIQRFAGYPNVDWFLLSYIGSFYYRINGQFWKSVTPARLSTYLHSIFWNEGILKLQNGDLFVRFDTLTTPKKWHKLAGKFPPGKYRFIASGLRDDFFIYLK